MAGTTVTAMKAIKDYFFGGANKVSMSEFRDEWNKLSDADRTELATGIVEITGDTLSLNVK
jgi:hypothetical protein